MEIIPIHVLQNLIALGNLSENDSPERRKLFEALRPFDSCGRTHANAWISATEKLSAEQISSLTRGLVFAEELLPGWNGGSVSGIIWTFRAFQQKAPEQADELADWIFKHSTNNYVPHGLNRAGAKSVEEYEAYRKAKESRRFQSEKHSEAEQHCKIIREAVTQRQQHEAVLLQKAKAQVRAELIEKLDGLTPKERLEHIAWDDEHDLTFFPEKYSEVALTEIDSLDEISRDRLISKLKQRHKGCWSELLARITK
jgi:hypothetical protein